MTNNLFIFKKQTLIGLIFSFCAGSLFAAEGHPYLGGSMGVSLSKIGNSNPVIHYDDDDLLTDAYPIRRARSNRLLMSGNTGYEFTGCRAIPSLALGLGLYGTPADYTYKGQLVETALDDPSTTLYDYSFNINSLRLMAEAQLSWTLGNVVPFIQGGIGPAWNRLSGYSEAPVNNSGFVALPPFQTHNNTNFAYQAGAGLGYGFNFAGHCSEFKHERLALGYRYANLGDASFKSRGSVYPHPLNFGKLTSNEIYLSYTHLF